MKRRIFGILVALVLVAAFSLVLALPVAAVANGGNIYYVATDGNDTTGDGSLGTPWATIGYALTQVVSGDTINVAAGTYNENITLVDGVEVLGAGDDVTTIDGGGSGSVVTAISVGSTTKLDGFTITNGSATNGGGMNNSNSSSPVVSNCTFSVNTADDSGGGMHNYNHSSPTVSNCTFSGNEASYGGGGMNIDDYSSPTVTDCTFSANTVDYYGGGMRITGYSYTVVSNCTFLNNQAQYNGNGLGGGMYSYASWPTVTNCTFESNTADYGGGGMANLGASPVVTNCIFSNNHANSFGGGIYNSNWKPVVTNCTFSGNTADWPSWAGGPGGKAMYNHACEPVVTNCILWDGGDEIYLEYGTSAPDISYCDVQGGYAGTGNIDADPLFVNPAGDDYHLQAASPCIDAGNNAAATAAGLTTDFDDEPRIMDGDGDLTATVDMGVDECLAQVWVDDDWAGTTPGDPVNGYIFGTDAFATITAAIDAVVSGGTVNVHPGTYIENNITIGKSLTVESVSGDWHDTIVDPAGPVFALPGAGSGPFASDVTISGLTIAGGSEGIYIFDGLAAGSTVRVFNCLIYDNSSAGIYAGNLIEGDIFIDDCIIAENGSIDTGIHLISVAGTVEITDSVIGAYWDAGTSTSYAGNGGDGIAIGMIEATGNVLIDNNKIVNNSGNGFDDGIMGGCFGQLTIINNVIGAYDYDLTSEDGYFGGNDNDGISIDYIGPTGVVTIEANRITENSCGIRIFDVDGGRLLIHGNTVAENTEDLSGIHIQSASATADVSVSLNNILDNTGDGVYYSYGGGGYLAEIDAENNWWGDASGPGGEGPGTGEEVSANVDYEPWLEVSVEEAKAGTITDGTLDNVDGADTEVIVTGSAIVTAAKYSGNPGSGFSGDTGKYIDVHINDPAGVTEIGIRLYYAEAEITGLVESTLSLSWWNGTGWVDCSDSGVNTTDITGPPAYSGYMWAKIRSDTTPTLAQLTGSVFGGGGALVPSPVWGGDTTAPRISNVLTCYDGVTETTADICWRTTEQGTSQVEYEASPGILSPLDETYVNEHHVHLTGLTPCTTYSYRTMSMDRAGNLAVSDVYTFTTLGEATFTSSDLSISPGDVSTGEMVTIGVMATNTCSCLGSSTVTLKINGVVEGTSEVTLEPGVSESVIFTVSRDEAGAYSVDIDGLSGSFTVTAPEEAEDASTNGAALEDEPPVNWPLIGGIIAGVVAIGLLIFFVARRRAG